MKYFVIPIVFFLTFVEKASASTDQGLGDVFSNLVGIGMSAHDIIRTVCILTGVGMLLGTIVQFAKYRRNPIETRLSLIILNFIIGICLIGLAFVPMQLSGK